jgi:hypothetical protein
MQAIANMIWNVIQGNLIQDAVTEINTNALRLLGPFAPYLPRTEMDVIISPFVNELRLKNEAAAQIAHEEEISRVAPFLSVADANGIAKSLLASIRQTSKYSDIESLANSFVAVGPRVGDEYGFALAIENLDLLSVTEDNKSTFVSKIINTLVFALNSDEKGEVVTKLLQIMSDLVNSKMTDDISASEAVLSKIVPLLNSDQLRRFTRQIVDTIKKTPWNFNFLEAVPALLPFVDQPEAFVLARAIIVVVANNNVLEWDVLPAQTSFTLIAKYLSHNDANWIASRLREVLVGDI